MKKKPKPKAPDKPEPEPAWSCCPECGNVAGWAGNNIICDACEGGVVVEPYFPDDTAFRRQP